MIENKINHIEDIFDRESKEIKNYTKKIVDDIH